MAPVAEVRSRTGRDGTASQVKPHAEFASFCGGLTDAWDCTVSNDSVAVELLVLGAARPEPERLYRKTGRPPPDSWSWFENTGHVS